jgi:hypothetical protein
VLGPRADPVGDDPGREVRAHEQDPAADPHVWEATVAGELVDSAAADTKELGGVVSGQQRLGQERQLFRRLVEPAVIGAPSVRSALESTGGVSRPAEHALGLGEPKSLQALRPRFAFRQTRRLDGVQGTSLLVELR